MVPSGLNSTPSGTVCSPSAVDFIASLSTKVTVAPKAIELEKMKIIRGIILKYYNIRSVLKNLILITDITRNIYNLNQFVVKF